MARFGKDNMLNNTVWETMESPQLRLGYFPEWENKFTMILFSGDRRLIKELERMFFDLSNGKIKEIWFDKLGFIKPYNGIKVLGFVSDKDDYIEYIAGDNEFHWVLPKHRWEDFAYLISVFNDKDAGYVGHRGHHYLDTPSKGDIKIMVSVDEYSDEWWSRNSL